MLGHVRAGGVARDVGPRARFDARRRHAARREAAHVGASDAEAVVGALEGGLDRREVGVVALVVQAELHLVADGLGSGDVALVDEGQHGRREDGALRRVLLRPIRTHLRLARDRLADLVRVAERALHERHRHLLDDRVDDGAHGGAVAVHEVRLARDELREQLLVDIRQPRAPRLAGAKVGAPLLREPVDHLAGRAATHVRPLERAGVEGDALVPRVHRLVLRAVRPERVRQLVAVQTVRAVLAVVDRVLKLADHVHPHVHVRRPLLDRLDPRGVAERGEVVRAVPPAAEGHVGAVEGGAHPLVGVVKVLVVVVEGREGLVRAADAAVVHLALGAGGEALHGAEPVGGLARQRVPADGVIVLRQVPVRRGVRGMVGKSAPIALVVVFLHLAPCGRFDVRLVGRRARDVSRAIPAGGLVDLNRDIRARRVARSIVHVAAGHVASTVRHVRRAHCAVAARGVGAFLAVAHEQRAALGVEAAAEGRVPLVVILRDGLDVGARRVVQVVGVALKLGRLVLSGKHDAGDARGVQRERRVLAG